ncbi:hypothetical protein BHM03_00040705 [Ensete ventricosum]|nr:hypothetical protein BHM03_00040705 [Ensete ventricosum]
MWPCSQKSGGTKAMWWLLSSPPPIGSFAPLHPPIDLVTMLDVSQGMTRRDIEAHNMASGFFLGMGDRLSIVIF